MKVIAVVLFAVLAAVNAGIAPAAIAPATIISRAPAFDSAV
ncbi:unnamed protein product, partial [Allacma fusca]